MKHYILPFLLIVTIFLIIFSGNFTDNTSIIKQNKKIEAKLFGQYNNDYLFVFFGYVGCTDICTPRLTELSSIYDKLTKEHNIDIDTVFINLIKLEDKELPQLFASYFHEDFDGFYINNANITFLENEFNIYSSPSLFRDGEYDHTSFLFLLKKVNNEYYLKRIYTNSPFDKDKIVNDILKGM